MEPQPPSRTGLAAEPPIPTKPATGPEHHRRRLDELVGAAAVSWASERRAAAALLLAEALVAARALASALAPEAAAPADALGTLGRLRERDRRALREAFDGADLEAPSTFTRTSAALRRASKAIHLLDPKALRRRRIAMAAGALFGVLAAAAIVVLVLANVERPEDRIFGGSGGTPYDVRCPEALRVVGVDVMSRGPTITGLRPYCLDASSPVEATPTTAIGRRGDRQEELRCEPGMVAVGINGRAGARIDRLTLLCAPFEDPSNGTETLRPVGGQGGSVYRARCREGSVAGFRGQAGAVLDAVGVVCVEGGP